MDLSLLWPIGLSLLLAWGAFTDVTARRLANWLSLVLFVTGLAFALATGGFSALGWHAAHAIIVLLIGMGLFAIGAFGGGDAKFYAGMAAWFPLSAALKLFVLVAISGLVLMIGWMILRRTLLKPREPAQGDFAKFPYGIAIATGGILASWLPFTGFALRGL